MVIGIELAGDAAAGSFQSSMTAIVGKTDLQITANGGVDERWMGKLVELPVNARFAPVMERQVALARGGSTTLYGIDAVSAGEGNESAVHGEIAVSSDLAARLHIKKGGAVGLKMNGSVRSFVVGQVVEAKNSEFLAMDIADAQQALNAYGKLDRIEVFVSPREDFGKVERLIGNTLPPGYSVNKPGTRSNENQRMLRAFRWNLRVLSYISLVVGAFLIYNTISISVVRRRVEIGILRALGAGRWMVFSVFLVEALLFGIVGAAVGLGLGRLMAEALVGLISITVNSLYTSSRPAEIVLTVQTAMIAAGAGLGVALAAAFGPAYEAMRVTPQEAMSRGSRERRETKRTGRYLLLGLVLGACAYIAALQEPVNGSPIFGYLAVVLAIGSAAMAAPALVTGTVALSKGLLRRVFGVAGMVATQGLIGSLGRTSVVVAALSTAIAMMASVGIMVGSFRETVIVWLDSQLRADLYVRASGPQAPGVFPPIAAELPGLLCSVPGVAALDVFSGIEFRYEGQRASLGGEDIDVLARYGRLRFLAGGNLPSLKGRDRVIVTQAFASKHGLHVGEQIELPLGGQRARLTVAGIYYDYTSERGFVLMDREVMLKYLPGIAPTNLAIYLAPGTDRDAALRAVKEKAAAFPLDIAPNQVLRQGAVEIFDRTFAVTYALEGVAVIIAMLGAANSLLAMVLDRRREFGLLQYLGGAAGQIKKMILVEAALLGLLANILGVVLGFALSLVLIYVINVQSFGWSIQFHPPYFLLSAALLMVWCVTIVAGIYPARVASRLKPIDVVHSE